MIVIKRKRWKGTQALSLELYSLFVNCAGVIILFGFAKKKARSWMTTWVNKQMKVNR